MPEPQAGAYSVTLSDLDSENTNRGEDGVAFRERIRAGIYKLEYRALVTTSELEKIISAIKADKFTVEFYFGENVTAQMYAGDKSISLVARDETNSNDRWEIAFNLVEY